MPVILHSDQLSPWLNNSVDDDQVIDDYGLGWESQYQYRMVEPFGVRDEGVELAEGFDRAARQTYDWRLWSWSDVLGRVLRCKRILSSLPTGVWNGSRMGLLGTWMKFITTKSLQLSQLGWPLERQLFHQYDIQTKI